MPRTDILIEPSVEARKILEMGAIEWLSRSLPQSQGSIQALEAGAAGQLATYVFIVFCGKCLCIYISPGK